MMSKERLEELHKFYISGIFDNGGFGIWKDVRVDLYSNQMRKLREPLWNLVIDECEIVGNVYQDKHLLEGEE